jgi:hypothetical protein
MSKVSENAVDGNVMLPHEDAAHPQPSGKPTFAQTFMVRGEMFRRFRLFTARTPIMCVKVPISDPDALALMGAGPHFEPVFGPECMALCFGEAPQYRDDPAPLNDLAEWLRSQQS